MTHVRDFIDVSDTHWLHESPYTYFGRRCGWRDALDRIERSRRGADARVIDARRRAFDRPTDRARVMTTVASARLAPRARRATPSTTTTSTTTTRGFASSTTCARPRTVRAAAASSSRPVVIIDNYDSFTYNLSQYLGDCGCDHVVYKNDEVTVEEVRAMRPRGVMVSPGPGRPEDSGISLDVVRELGPEFGVFGVCMGHQCIGQVFGGNIVRAPTGLMHGKSSPVTHVVDDEGTLLHGLPSPFQAARYHSLVIDRVGFPEDELEVTAWTEDDTIMAVRHKKYPWIQGVQFHPESIITEDGLTIVKNWVRMIDARAAEDH